MEERGYKRHVLKGHDVDCFDATVIVSIMHTSER